MLYSKTLWLGRRDLNPHYERLISDYCYYEYLMSIKLFQQYYKHKSPRFQIRDLHYNKDNDKDAEIYFIMKSKIALPTITGSTFCLLARCLACFTATRTFSRFKSHFALV